MRGKEIKKMSMKPILFNTEMVRAILDGRKTVTRRAVKPQPTPSETNPHQVGKNIGNETFVYFDHTACCGVGPYKLPYRTGDILYVRETWALTSDAEIRAGVDPNKYFYKADVEHLLVASRKWRPSIHMPKDAARIFLRVTDVRVEKLQDIDEEGAKAEGANVGAGFSEKMERSAIDRFTKIWNSTIPKHPNKFKRYPYYWNDNPWVWVVEFERISREEATQ